ncbi:MAG: helix-turn-helix domain-containing protein [Treponemataceae bacterium]|nr:helix-turn-helix domain-containing protein [Treponemataceae bacterium]
MERYGEILRNAREEQGIDINQVERETAISKEYIQALENEDSSVFPGEPYLVGFLNNYADYLGLSAKDLIKLYHGKMIQEAPVPEALLKKEKPAYLKPLIISLSCIVVAAAVAVTLIFTVGKKKDTENEILEASKTGKTYELASTPIRKRIYKNDILKFTANGKEIEVKVVGTKEYLSIETPVGIQVIEIGDESNLDLDSIEGPDLGIFVSDISKTDEGKGAEVRMWAYGDMSAQEKAKKEAAQKVNEEDDKNITKASELSQKQLAAQTVLFDGMRAYPFTVEVNFRGATLLRVSPDGKDTEENYYTAGQRVTKTVNNKLRLWVSNAYAIQIQVIGDGKSEKIDVGRPGQVMVKDIKWIKDHDGHYKLVVLEVD